MYISSYPYPIWLYASVKRLIAAVLTSEFGWIIYFEANSIKRPRGTSFFPIENFFANSWRIFNLATMCLIDYYIFGLTPYNLLNDCTTAWFPITATLPIANKADSAYYLIFGTLLPAYSVNAVRLKSTYLIIIKSLSFF